MTLPPGTIERAQAIHASLVRGRLLMSHKNQNSSLNLTGACGLASVMLCVAVGDLALTSLVASNAHVWNEFPRERYTRGVIVDITAAQFRSAPFGVCVARRPREYHRLGYYGIADFYRGRQVLEMINRRGWYVDVSYGCTSGEIARWRKLMRQLKGTRPSSTTTGSPTRRG